MIQPHINGLVSSRLERKKAQANGTQTVAGHNNTCTSSANNPIVVNNPQDLLFLQSVLASSGNYQLPTNLSISDKFLRIVEAYLEACQNGTNFNYDPNANQNNASAATNDTQQTSQNGLSQKYNFGDLTQYGIDISKYQVIDLSNIDQNGQNQQQKSQYNFGDLTQYGIDISKYQVIDLSNIDQNGQNQQQKSQYNFGDLTQYGIGDISKYQVIDLSNIDQNGQNQQNIPQTYVAPQYYNNASYVIPEITQPQQQVQQQTQPQQQVQEQAQPKIQTQPKVQVQNNNTGLNEKIEPTEQGYYGDCWLLSGLNSLTTNDAGKKVIENAITNNQNGTYTVNFKGINRSYTYSLDDIKNADADKKYSSGDRDVMLFELAVQDCREEALNGKDFGSYDDYVKRVSNLDTSIKDTLDMGGVCSEMYQLFGLNPTTYTTKQSNYKNNANNVLNKIEQNPAKYNSTFICQEASDGTNYATDINGNKVKMVNKGVAHAWSIKSVDKNNVTIVNPWYAEKNITLTRNELMKFMTDISYVEMA